MTGRTMSERLPEDSEPPEHMDEAMLAALSNSGRNAAALTTAEERLLDDWIAGRLSEDARKRAAALTRRNALAAERYPYLIEQFKKRRCVPASSRPQRHPAPRHAPVHVPEYAPLSRPAAAFPGGNC